MFLPVPYAVPPPESPVIKWSCMVCGRWRPDHLIGVASRSVEVRGVELAPFHVRYCRDTARCVTAATAAGPWPGWTDDARRTLVAEVGPLPPPGM